SATPSGPRRWLAGVPRPPSTNLAASRGIVPVRDSKVAGGPVVAVPATAFAAFVAGVRGGTFDTV
ncbi:hypothetical protein ACZ90_70775, partial [Streptomyces albus subsp. albus]